MGQGKEHSGPFFSESLPISNSCSVASSSLRLLADPLPSLSLSFLTCEIGIFED